MANGGTETRDGQHFGTFAQQRVNRDKWRSDLSRYQQRQSGNWYQNKR